MLKREDGIPNFLKSPYPYRDRPRSDAIYGVTEIIFCLRKSMLARVVPSPTALDNDTRKRFARGHAFEKIFFGDIQNPIHFRGGVVEGRDFSKVEGHTDHSCVDEQGRSVIVEFKSTKRLWLEGPDGNKYYSMKAARAALPKEQWKLVDHVPSQSHVDQLQFYMLLNNASRGYLIYHELSTDDNYTWSMGYEDIPEEFKDEMLNRLDELEACFVEGRIPERSEKYEWECKLCNFRRDGLCQLCDVDEFNLTEFIEKFKRKKDPFSFIPLVKQYFDKYGLDKSTIEMDLNPDENGKEVAS